MKFLKPLLLTAVSAFPFAALADVSLPAIISSKMVLQRDAQVPIWGWANPDEEVSVQFDDQLKSTRADSTGRWRVVLDPMDASSSPATMTVVGKNTIVLDDVLVGEVWVASGQSNMEWTFRQIVNDEVDLMLSEKENDQIRMFRIPKVQSGLALADVDAHWADCREIARTKAFSAVAYFFARKLQQELKVPVACIDNSWGGRRIELFISDEGYRLAGLPAPEERLNDSQAIELLEAHIEDSQAALVRAQAGDFVSLPPVSYQPAAANGIYRGMVHPIKDFAVKGAIWYQGEANRGDQHYFDKLRALSAGWSKAFGNKDMPILMVQIAPFQYTGKLKDTTLCDSVWAAQYRAEREIKGMELVSIHDTNINVRDIHPRHKKPVGERLCAKALNRVYGVDVPADNPYALSAERSGSHVTVTFAGVQGILLTKDGEAPREFELSADGVSYYPANAKIVDRVSVEMYADEVSIPRFVRFGWYEISIPNLVDRKGWPAMAFSPISLGAKSKSEIKGIKPTLVNVSYGPHDQQVLNFWKAESTERTPVLFTIHGGGWKGGAKDEVLTSDYWLKQGVSVVSIDYRLSGEAILPAPVMDAARALQYVRYKAKEWNLDKERIALTGGSAGGASSLWLSLHDDLADPENADPVLRESTKPLCALSLNGQTSVDPVWVAENVGERASMHYMVWASVGAANPKVIMQNLDEYVPLAQQFSPIRFLDPNDPPVGLALSFPLSDQGIHSPWFGIRLKEKANKFGGDVTLFCKDEHELGRPFNDRNQFLQKYLLGK